MSNTNILGDSIKKSRFNKDLADRVNKDADIKSKKESQKLKKLVQSYSGSKPELVYAVGVHGVVESFGRYYDCVDFLRNLPVSEGFNHQPTIGVEKEIYIPLNMLESMELLLKEFNTDYNLDGSPRTLNHRLELFNYIKSTATGVAYSNDCEHIKIIPNCTDLILMQASDANKSHLPIVYQDSYKDCIELDKNKVKFNTSLSQYEVLTHKAWLASVGETVHGIQVLGDYADLIFKVLKKEYHLEQGMAFRTLEGSCDEDKLLALTIRGPVLGCDTLAGNPLHFNTNFLRYRGSQ